MTEPTLLQPGDRVRVIAPGDDLHGAEGVVEAILDPKYVIDTMVVRVAFPIEERPDPWPHGGRFTLAYAVDELERVES